MVLVLNVESEHVFEFFDGGLHGGFGVDLVGNEPLGDDFGFEDGVVGAFGA